MNNWRIKQYYNDQGKIKYMPQEKKFFFFIPYWSDLFLTSASRHTEEEAKVSIQSTIASRFEQKQNVKLANKILSYIYYKDDFNE